MKQRPSLLEILGLHFWDEAVCAASEAQLQDVSGTALGCLSFRDVCPSPPQLLPMGWSMWFVLSHPAVYSGCTLAVSCSVHCEFPGWI